MPYPNQPTAASTLLATIGLAATLISSSIAAAADVSDIEQRRLFEPTEAERAAEAEGRIYIYDGLTDRDVQRALDDEFERVDSMMFIRTRKTDEDGKIKRDEDTGEVEVEGDGC